ncbi:glycosyltransferase family 2 protein [Halococcus saccharolyticus]|uniref:Family 2 glycosyl transferase n=1 Tax=Halococcus saccharolyticus DSM 5350 TaxID=1227455 RepID=M0MDJ9_9EURY|nr:glycosyltransferase family 2 protein [Halococcus saccharolyticus]EMA43816.1 family 2 glycosyl transferase [Halococcus saccharolyticus DSM 5350]
MNTRNKFLSAVLWFCSLALVHTYLLYPAVLATVTRIDSTGRGELPAELPTVSLVIAAYNEAGVIARKIENSLTLEYPSEKLEIIVFSDASSDRTDEIVNSYAEHGVQLIRVEGRVGKTECQNVVAEQVDSEIIVFSDANSMYESDAIQELVRSFKPGIGCVVGELRYGDADGVEGESTYWRYERLIKRLESELGSVVTGNGSIYAVRNAAYVPLPQNAISDFAEPLALIEDGYRVAYCPSAVAWEQTGASVESELSRRIRIVTRSWNTLSNHTGLLNVLRYPSFGFKLLSHKVFRWLSPVFLIGVFLTSVLLAVLTLGPLYLALVAFQLGFYCCAVVGAVGDRLGWQTHPVFHVPYYFVVSNYGMGRAMVNLLNRRNFVTWETEDRSVEE